MPDDFRLPWFPRIRFPENTPRIRDQLRCPPGTHRRLGAGPDAPCVSDGPAPPGTLVEIPADAFVGPVVPRPVPRPQIPPKAPTAPPPTAPPPTASPSGGSVVDRTTGRYFPRGRTLPLPTLPQAAARAGLVLWVLGTLIFQPTERLMREAGTLPRPRSAGPPRRGSRRAPVAAPIGFPEFIKIIGPFPIPTGGADVRAPTVSTRPRTLPGTRTPVQRVPAPTGSPWGAPGFPLPSPAYDPFTVAPPTPRPIHAPAGRPAGRPRPRVLPFLPGFGLPGGQPRAVPRTLTPQQPRARDPLTRPPAPSPLTPVNPGLSPLPQFQAKPTSSNPCTTERTARRRRQKDCQSYTTKTIRVCADK